MPAERAIWPPRPGCSSTLWTTVPTGMLASGRQLPTEGSTRRPREHRRADLQPRGRQDVALDAVGVVQQRDVGGAVGVVLDRGDLRRDAVLAALEVDLAVQALGPAAAMARGLAAVGVAATGLLEALDERLLGLGLRDLGEVGVGDEAAAGRCGLGLANRHRATPRPDPGGAAKIGIESPARTWTIAFFQERVRPDVSPRRLGLDLTEVVRTSTTLTSKSASTAWRICVLCASGWTRNVYLSAAAST